MYGTGPYGTGSFGGPIVGISLASAFASSTHSVRVTLSAPPLVADGFADGDVRSPATWTVTRQDTLEQFTVLGVEAFAAPLVWDVYVLEPFASYLVTHRVRTETLRAADGLIVTAPHEIDFAGLTESMDPVPQVARGVRDLRNPQFPTSGESVGGTLVMGADGDYESEQGLPFYRKMITRILTTEKGSIFHLPEFGLKLRLKEPIVVSAGGAVRLRGEAEAQVKSIRDIRDARANVEIQRGGVVNLQVSAVVDGSGQLVTANVRLDSGRGVKL